MAVIVPGEFSGCGKELVIRKGENHLSRRGHIRNFIKEL